MKLSRLLILSAALLGATVASAGPKNPLKDCETVGSEAGALAKADPSSAENVAREAVMDRPDCACVIVKEVILGAGYENDSDGVVSIVKGAVDAAGDQVKIIAECAIVVSPGSTSAIITFIDATYGRGTAASLGLIGRSQFIVTPTGAGNNFIIPPAYVNGSVPTNVETPSGSKPGGSKPGGSKPGGGSPGVGPKPPVGTPGDPK